MTDLKGKRKSQDIATKVFPSNPRSRTSLTDFRGQTISGDATAKISPGDLTRKPSMADFKGTKKFEDDTTKTVSSNSTVITSMNALTSNQFEDAAKKIVPRATNAIRSEWRITFTSSGSLRSTLVRLDRENESTTVHVLVKNVTEDQIDKSSFSTNIQPHETGMGGD